MTEASHKPYGPEVILDAPAFIHPTAQIYGKVKIGRDASLWPNTVVRSEFYEVEIGPMTNIQDFVMVHIGGHCGTHIGAHCSITHHCTIHGCTIGDNCLIGINATIMDGCKIGENSIVAGGAFLKEGTEIPANSIVMGMPGKVTKTRNNWVANRFNAWLYYQNALAYSRGFHRVWDGPEAVAAGKAEMKRLMAEFGKLYPAEA
jgi:carbonic anhydrase/acetyltransferase-like protein (isoleucine patch superfamily)